MTSTPGIRWLVFHAYWIQVIWAFEKTKNKWKKRLLRAHLKFIKLLNSYVNSYKEVFRVLLPSRRSKLKKVVSMFQVVVGFLLPT